jgi:phytanoyl-CoA hydroxylase
MAAGCSNLKMPKFLSQDQIDQYNSDGCLVIHDFWTSQQVAEAKAEVARLIAELDLSKHPKTTFSTGDTQIGDEYFLSSGDECRCFLEDSTVQNGQLLVDKEQAVNKIGHGLHLKNDVFKKLTAGQAFKDIADDLGLDAQILQSMLIMKAAKTGGVVESHQDSTFLYSDPPSAMGCWIPLDNCTTENGCLYFAPGSHKEYPITKRFVRRVPFPGVNGDRRDSDAAGTTFVSTGLSVVAKEPTNWVAAETPAGSLVLIHGSVLHKSSANTSSQGRQAYTFHMIDSNCAYDALNWLQPSVENPSFTKLKEFR